MKLFTLRESRRGAHELCEHRSDRRETSAKRVSDDLQLLICWRRIFFTKKKNSDSFLIFLFLSDFEGFGEFWTSKSDSSRYFASDGQIFRSVARLEWQEAANLANGGN